MLLVPVVIALCTYCLLPPGEMGKSKSKKGGAGASASAGGGAGGGGGAQQQQQQQQNSKAAGPRCSVCRAEGSEIKYNCPVDRVG